MKHFYCVIICLLLTLRLTCGAPGDLDTFFNGTGRVSFGLGGADDIARAAARQTDGKIVVVGKSSQTGGEVVRYNANGTLDTTFGAAGKLFPLASGDLVAVAILSTGKILAAGSAFNSASASVDLTLVRINTDGSLDSTFGTNGVVLTDLGGSDQATGMTVQPDGKVVVAGYSVDASSNRILSLARFNANGTLDTTFDGDGKVSTTLCCNYRLDSVGEVLVFNGRIYVCGSVFSNLSLGFLGCYNSDGSPYSGFGTNGFVYKLLELNGAFESITLLAVVAGEEKIVVAGYSRGSSAGSISQQIVGSFDANNGTLDNSFGNGGFTSLSFDSAGHAVRIQNSSGVASRIVVVGESNGDFLVSRYLLNGTLDTGYDNDGIVITDIDNGTLDQARALIVQPSDNRVVAIGTTFVSGEDRDFASVRLNTSGTLDTSFSGDGKEVDDIGPIGSLADCMLAQPDGRIVAAGGNAVGRFNADGTFDTSFDVDGKAKVRSGDIVGCAIQPDGKLLFVASTQTNVVLVYRLNTDGTLDTSFDGDGAAQIAIGQRVCFPRAIAVQSDGAIVIGGSADITSSGTSNYDFALARLTASGAPDSSFGTGGVITASIAGNSEFGQALAIQSDGKIVLGGYANTTPSYDFALLRFNANGTLDPSFSGDGKQTIAMGASDDFINAIALSGSQIIAAGASFNGTNYDFAMSRINADGNLDTSFGTNGKVITAIGTGDDIARSVALLPNGKILLAGDIGTNLHLDFALARYTASGVLDSSYGNGGKIVITGGDRYAGDQVWTVALDRVGRVITLGTLYPSSVLIRTLGDPFLKITSFAVRSSDQHIVMQGLAVPGVTNRVFYSSSLTTSFNFYGILIADVAGNFTFDFGTPAAPKFYELTTP